MMAEKRFKLGVGEQYGAILDNDKIMHKNEIVELLNALYEENRELQRHLDVMRSGALTDDKRIKELYNENEWLKAQLYCDSDEGVCTICKHHYLEKGKTYEKYYISKCKKEHEKCSKMDLKYCDDFELKKVVE